MNFLNHRFLFFNIFNNFIKDFYRDTIIMKTHLLINFVNHINKLHKVFDKQILLCPLLDNFCKSLKKIR